LFFDRPGIDQNDKCCGRPDALEDSASPKKDEGSAAGRPGPKITRKTAVVGAAIGIGSAAIAAALLYANRGNKS